MFQSDKDSIMPYFILLARLVILAFFKFVFFFYLLAPDLCRHFERQ